MKLNCKAPFRPRTDPARVSEVFVDGMVTIYAVTAAAGNGRAPVEVPTPKLRLPYQERKLGIKRAYEAKQNNIHVERVIRVPLPPTAITNQDLATTEDGRKFRIDLVQIMKDSFPPCADLTLVANDQVPQDSR